MWEFFPNHKEERKTLAHPTKDENLSQAAGQNEKEERRKRKVIGKTVVPNWFEIS